MFCQLITLFDKIVQVTHQCDKKSTTVDDRRIANLTFSRACASFRNKTKKITKKGFFFLLYRIRKIEEFLLLIKSII
jgi:hypothetical protein